MLEKIVKGVITMGTVLSLLIGCSKKFEVKEGGLSLQNITGIVYGEDVKEKHYDNILVPGDGIPEFFVSGISDDVIKIYVDEDFKKKIGEVFIGSRFCDEKFNYKNENKGIYSESINLPGWMSGLVISSMIGVTDSAANKYHFAKAVEIMKSGFSPKGTAIWGKYE